MRGFIGGLLVFCLLFSGVSAGDLISPNIVQAKISVVGDIMVHQQQLDALRKDNYNFKPTFDKVKPFLESADLTMGNLETTLSGADRKYTGYPAFNSPDTLAEALKYAGFDVITTVNNHSLDRGITGLTRTLEVLNKQGLRSTGTFKDKESRDTILIEDVKGIKVAILAYTFSTNGVTVPKGKEFSVNYINKTAMVTDIKKAKELGSDLVVVNLHMGTEYERQPNSSQKEMVNFLFNNGVDIVFGSHPHVIQSMEFKTIEYNGEKKDCFVVYSLGNFVSNMKSRYKNTGMVLSLDIEKNKDTGKTIIKGVEYVPAWVDTNGGKHTIVPLKSTIEQMTAIPTSSKTYLANMRDRLKDVVDLIGTKDSRIVVK